MLPKMYKVGGWVRDQILGVKSKDIDYAVEASSFDEMRQHIINLGGKIWLETPKYLTIRAHLNGEDADFVLCRKDGEYVDNRHPSEVTVGTIFDDLARRDFTMNAIAISEDGKYLDPHNGLQDIRYKCIRCVGNAEDRFSEDALRIVRAVRFSIVKDMEFHWSIHYALQTEKIVKGLASISHERIREELNKCFAVDTLKTSRMIFVKYPLVGHYCFNESGLKLEATMKGFKK